VVESAKYWSMAMERLKNQRIEELYNFSVEGNDAYEVEITDYH
jgi:hypothetical protein